MAPEAGRRRSTHLIVLLALSVLLNLVIFGLTVYFLTLKPWEVDECPYDYGSDQPTSSTGSSGYGGGYNYNYSDCITSHPSRGIVL